MPTRNLRRKSAPVGLLKVSSAVRDGVGCTRHYHLSGESLSKWAASCSQGCTHLMGAAYHRVSRTVAVILLFVLTALHPVLHAFEGGALDALLVALMARVSLDD